MSVDRPVREDNVGFVIRQRVREFFVAGHAHFGAAIDVVEGNHSAFQNGARTLGLGVPPGGQFLRGHVQAASNALGISARERERDYVMIQVRIAGDGPPATCLRIIDVSSYDDYLQLSLRGGSLRGTASQRE